MSTYRVKVLCSVLLIAGMIGGILFVSNSAFSAADVCGAYLSKLNNKKAELATATTQLTNFMTAFNRIESELTRNQGNCNGEERTCRNSCANEKRRCKTDSCGSLGAVAGRICLSLCDKCPTYARSCSADMDALRQNKTRLETLKANLTREVADLTAKVAQCRR